MKLGILGTMVWDRIEHPEGEVVQRWGGISYSLAAAAAVVPEGSLIRPIIRLGSDLAAEGRAFLDTLPALQRPGGVVEVPEPNNRVRLAYRDRHDRDEYLEGGVGGWAWSELEPWLDGLDGLYVNMISGFELDGETAERLADRFPGFRYVDLHSLVQDIGEGGHRVPRRPPRPEAWFRSFHVVQGNERELGLMAGADDPMAAARKAVRNGTRAVVVTRGPRGARWVARRDARLWPDPGPPSAGVDEVADRAPVRSGQVESETPWVVGDPTGCGDVWGATCFVRLMEGARLSEAVAAANRAAARNVDHRGADGLYEHLKEALWT